MTDEKYEDLKKGYLENIQRYMIENGNIFPHLTVFASHKKQEETQDAIVHIPIPSEFVQSEEMKEKFLETMVPAISKKLNEDFTPYGVSFTSEAWVRTHKKEAGELPDNWKELPIDKEVLLITMEFHNKKETLVYEIKRVGKQVNDDGDLVDHVELVQQDFSGAESVGGRFTNLLERFTN